MAATVEEIERFTDFAKLQVVSGNPVSLEECIRQWRVEQERRATVEDILEGRKEYEAGRSQSLPEAFDDVRRALGWTK